MIADDASRATVFLFQRRKLVLEFLLETGMFG
jgi:hypothetical protein